ncbi:unnamed protein product [Musa acuminata subsp. malaccensis]|uniref:(wild Malaysian banana) hypothetical protein n=1 Tax=Musa acuminata subsp. malaccensis TaxID=214687 RepID=A0A804L0N4_MUSAM|nr:unnamed protein product [Musa acuminata subsp. malaccensis]
MLVFETSGLLLWPVLRLLGLRLTVFVAVAGVRDSEVEAVARAVLPKSYMDDVGVAAWNVFGSSVERRVVVTRWARMVVERVAMDHPATALHCMPFSIDATQSREASRPTPVIFHDGRLVSRPTTFTALLIILWIPLGVVIAFIRIAVGLLVLIWVIPFIARSPCEVPAVTYSISRLSEILSLIRTVRLRRDRQADAEGIRAELANGDLVLTDRIVPVAMNYRVGLLHATDPIFFFMNPRPIYEVTFLNQLPLEATSTAGKSPHDVANYVQRILAASVGFECTKFTRKDKYRKLAGKDGTVNFKLATSPMERVKEVLGFLRCTT